MHTLSNQAWRCFAYIILLFVIRDSNMKRYNINDNNININDIND